MKWIPATALLAVMISAAAPAYASSTPGLIISNLRPTPNGLTFGTGGGSNDPAGCPTSPENPTVLLAAFALAGLYVGRKVNRTVRLRTVLAGR